MTDVIHSPVSVVVIDDEPSVLRAWRRLLSGAGFDVALFDSPGAAMQHLDAHGAQVVVVDIFMPEMSGMQVLQVIKERWPEIEVVATSGQADVDIAVEAMKRGAYDFLTKPYRDPETIRHALLKAAAGKRVLAAATRAIIGQSPAMRQMLDTARRAAESTAPVLIYGETGTGKELVARAIHEFGPRRKQPLFAVNCSALTETLLEEELFGHIKGAFTGATRDRPGIFETADGSSVLLDEISDMSARCQGMLLRTLQEGEVRPVGSSHAQKVDVRVIAASNVDLERCCQEKTFRRDLYYRLNVIPIHLPPLRERPGDIPLLATHLLERYAEREGKEFDGIKPSTMEQLCRYSWPGNVRELENTIRRAVALAPPGKRLSTTDVPVVRVPVSFGDAPQPAADALLGPFAEAKAQAMADFERGYLMAILE
jgi:DNA-binding NtrC family response regulator